MINIIKGTENDEINWVYHIADIHVKYDERRKKEFEEVFNSVLNRIKNNSKTNRKNTYSVIAGDLLDDGVKLKAISIELLCDFLIKLSKKTKLFIIAGNHDNNIKGSSPNERKDTLSALFKFIEEKKANSNIHYLRDTGIYKAGNCLFYVPSIFDLEKCDSNSKEDWLKRLEILPSRIESPDDHHILLGHFSLDGTPVQNGYLLRDQFFKVGDIQDKYDICMLGDNHKVNHILGEKNNIGYPGSLIQLNSGEQLQNHGILLWNLKQKKSTFLAMETNFGFATFDTTQENFQFNIEPLPKNIRIKIKYNNIETYEKILKLLDKQKTHNIIDINPEYIGNNNDIQETLSKIDIKNEDNFIEFLNIRFPNNKQLIDKISKIHSSYSKKLDIKNDIDDKIIKLNKLIIENFICFPKKITIDLSIFQKFTSIGILGKNGLGKSTILKAIKYAIQGKSILDTSLNPQNIKNIYNKKKKSYVSLEFIYGGILYKIERTTNKKESLTLKTHDGQKYTSVPGRKKKQIQNSITEIFGEQDVMLETWLSEQTNYNSFLKRTSKDRVKIFKKMLNLSKFEQEIKNKVNEDIRQIRGNKEICVSHINSYKYQIKDIKPIEDLKRLLIETNETKTELMNKIKKLNDTISQFKGKYSEIYNSNTIETIQLKFNNIKKKLKRIETSETELIIPNNFDFNLENNNNKFEIQILDIETQIAELQEQLKPVDQIYNKQTLKKANSEKKNFMTKQQNIETDKTNLTTQLTICMNSIMELNLDNSKQKITELNNQKYNDNQKLIDDLNYEISHNHNRISNFNQLINSSECVFDDNCEKCQINKNTLKITHYETNLNQEKILLNTNTNKHDNLKLENQKLIKWKDMHLKFQILQMFEYKQEQLNIKIKNNSDELKLYQQTLSNIQYKIDKCQETIQNIETNYEINTQISNFDDKIDDIRNQRKKYNSDYKKFTNYQFEIQTLQNKKLKLQIQFNTIQEYIKSKNDIEQKENKVKLLENQFITIEKKIIELNNDIKILNQISKKLLKREENFKNIENKFYILNEYKKIVQSYPSYLTNQIIEQFEILINTFLEKIVDFTLKIQYNDTELNITKVDKFKNQYLSTTLSGSESFIASSAIRYGLIQISKIAMCSSYLMDEGFGSLDNDKLYEFKDKIINFLKNQFENIIVITHIDEIKNILDYVIEVTNDDNNKINIIKNR